MPSCRHERHLMSYRGETRSEAGRLVTHKTHTEDAAVTRIPSSHHKYILHFRTQFAFRWVHLECGLCRRNCVWKLSAKAIHGRGTRNTRSAYRVFFWGGRFRACVYVRHFSIGKIHVIILPSPTIKNTLVLYTPHTRRCRRCPYQIHG